MFYSYDENFIFTKEVTGQKDPMDKDGESFLQPGRSTTAKPPELTVGKSAKYDEANKSWKIVPDSRYVAIEIKKRNSSKVLINKTDDEGFLISRSFSEIESDEKLLADNQYKVDREDQYNKAGLSLEIFLELIIENDNAGLAKFRSDREVIKLSIPKPN